MTKSRRETLATIIGPLAYIENKLLWANDPLGWFCIAVLAMCVFAAVYEICVWRRGK